MKPFSLFAGLALSAGLFASCNKDGGNGNTGGTNPSLETVYTDPTYQLTGVAKDPSSTQLMVSYPRWAGPYRYAVVNVTDPANTVPFPDAATNTWDSSTSGENKWVCVQSVYYDEDGLLYVLDPASPNMKGVFQNSHKLVRLNKVTGDWQRKYEYDGVVSNNGYLNDIRVDAIRQVAYMTNSSEGAIVVTDLNNGFSRQVLLGHTSTISDPTYRFTVDGSELSRNGQPVKINADGIALTPDRTWLYFKPLTDDKLYRIRTEYLRDSSISATNLGKLVEDLGHFVPTDGMIFDKMGYLYMGDLSNHRIVRVDPSNGHAMTTLLTDDRLLWPDSYSIANDYLYISCSQIHLQPEYNNGVNRRTTPYAVYRVKLR